MSTLTLPAERIAAAGRSRAAASPGVEVSAEHAAAASFAAAGFGGWGSNPTTGMPVQKVQTKRHDPTPAPRPEEASP